MSGVWQRGVLDLIEKELREGLSPVIILHPYELVRSRPWSRRFYKEVLRRPVLAPFFRDKSDFLKEIITRFPTSSTRSYLDELLHSREVASA
jgi:hypothetical protein